MTRKIFTKVERMARELFDLPRSTKKHFSFIVLRNKIVGFGVNDGFKTCPESMKFGHRFHATHSEVAAIKSIQFPPAYLKHCSLLNVRLRRDLSLGMARPCDKCQIFLRNFDFRKIFYTNDNGEWREWCIL